MTVATDDDILIELERRRRAQAAALPPPPVFRGAVAELHASTDHELMVAGPAETGKTFGTLWHLDRVLRENPRAQGAMVRKVAADIGPTVLRTYERVIAMSGSGATPQLMPASVPRPAQLTEQCIMAMPPSSQMARTSFCS